MPNCLTIYRLEAQWNGDLVQVSAELAVKDLFNRRMARSNAICTLAGLFRSFR